MSVGKLAKLLDEAGLTCPEVYLTVCRFGNTPIEIVFSSTATRGQREAAAAILANFDPDAPNPADVRRTLLTDLSNVPDWTPEQQNRVLRLLLHQVLGDDRPPG